MRKMVAFALVALLLFIVSGTTNADIKNKRFALIIGVSHYPNYKSVENLNYSDKDAEQFKAFLMDSVGGGGIPITNIEMLTNGSARKDSIENAINTISQKVNNNGSNADTVFIYYSGHIEIRKSTGNAYLMPFDARPKDEELFKTGFSVENFLNELKRSINAESFFIIIDACWAGSFNDPDGLGGESLKEENEVALSWIDDLTCNLLLSSRNYQKSRENRYMRSGLFTYYLLRGLKGEADSNNNLTVELNELCEYVQKSIMIYPENKKSEAQEPVFILNSSLKAFRLSQIIGATNINAAKDNYNEAIKCLIEADTTETISYLKKAVNIDSKFILAQDKLIQLLFARKEYYEAFAKYKLACETARQYRIEYQFQYGWLVLKHLYPSTLYFDKFSLNIAENDSVLPVKLPCGLNKLRIRDTRKIYKENILIEIPNGSIQEYFIKKR